MPSAGGGALTVAAPIRGTRSDQGMQLSCPLGLHDIEPRALRPPYLPYTENDSKQGGQEGAPPLPVYPENRLTSGGAPPAAE